MYFQKGFINIVVIVTAVVIVGVGGYFAVVHRSNAPATPNVEDIQSQNKSGFETAPVQPSGAPLSKPKAADGVSKSTPNKTQPQILQPSKLAQPGVGLFGQLCKGSGDFKLKTFPIDVGNIEYIRPMGRVQDSHVTPTNHQYVVPLGTKGGSFVTDNPSKYEIKAPADGYVISMEIFREPIEEQYRNQEYADNYLVVFEHSCDFYTRLIHIDTVSDRILAAATFRNPESQHPYASTRIPVAAGEVIGTVGSHSFDFQIISALAKNSSIISPKQLEAISAYTVDTFDYLTEPVRSALLKKNLVSREPLGGTIAYDLPGRLLGNWFKPGRDRNQSDYWVDELSVVYDYLDPTQIRVSLGNFNGFPKAHGVKGNMPDPARIDKNYGLVKYELVTFDYFDAQGVKWDDVYFANNLVAKNTDEVMGVVLFKMIDDTHLKFEVFPGKTAAQVAGFTAAALIYER